MRRAESKRSKSLFGRGIRGRAYLLAAAITVSVVIVGAGWSMNWRAKVVEDEATERLLEILTIADRMGADLSAVQDGVLVYLTAPDAVDLGDVRRASLSADAALARLGVLAEGYEGESALYARAAELREEYRVLERRAFDMLEAGQSDEALAYMQGSTYYNAALAWGEPFQRLMREMQDSARQAHSEMDRLERDALIVSAIGIAILAVLWALVIADWISQTIAARRAETRLATLNANLERCVAARTGELASALARAEQANRAKSEFLGAMSHELRTPLNGVMGMTTVLSKTDLDDNQRGMLDVVQSSGRSLLVLLNDLLDYARLEAGRMELHEEPFDMADLIEKTCALHTPEAERKGLRIGADIAPEVRGVFLGDSVRVGQVLGNLVSNAVKFTDTGRVDVVAVRNEGGARVVVRDTGCGVTPAFAERIFERFSQGDSSPRRRHGGAGLGLALSRELVCAMNGEIGMNARPEGGSEFWFTLPLAEADEALPSVSEEAA